MAYITKHRSGWRVQVNTKGVRRSKVFATKSAASQWAATEEAAIHAAEAGQYPRKTLADAVGRYIREVSAHKAGARPEGLRLQALLRDFPALAGKQLTAITTTDWAAWRDARLAKVTAGSVQRDVNIISNLYTVARDEWRWCGPSPLKGLRRPGDNPPRKRLPGWRELKRVLRWLGYRTATLPRTVQQQAAWAAMISLRTGMRAGEVLSLGPATVDLQRRVATLHSHKTSRTVGARHVPLSRKAARLLGHVDAAAKDQQINRYLLISGASLDATWRKACACSGVADLHFHDLRAAALTSLARSKVDPFVLAQISGHRDVRILMAVYYRESAEAIALRL